MAAFRQRQPEPEAMLGMTDTSYETQWFPVAGSGELPFRHVYHGELLGQEMAVWRATRLSQHRVPPPGIES